MSLVPFVNCFEVAPGREEAFLALWQEVNAYMAAKPGYLSHRLHRSLHDDARYRFVNYAEWETADQWKAAHDDGFRRLLSKPDWSEFTSTHALYEVVHQGGVHDRRRRTHELASLPHRQSLRSTVRTCSPSAPSGSCAGWSCSPSPAPACCANRPTRWRRPGTFAPHDRKRDAGPTGVASLKGHDHMTPTRPQATAPAEDTANHPESIDVGIMLLIHDAFRRDLGRLVTAVKALPGRDNPQVAAISDHWRFLDDQLRHHHHVEDDQLWPLVRAHLSGTPADLGVLETMEADHRRLEPLVDAVTTGLARLPDTTGSSEDGGTVEALEQLGAALSSHLDAEERLAVPLVKANIGVAEYAGFVKAQRRAVGLRGAARFFPWILDGADTTTTQATLGHLPAPLRLAYRHRWWPAYVRRAAALPS